MREHLVSVLTHMGVRADDIYRVEVIATEACSNVIRHAYDTPHNQFEVEILFEPHRLILTVADAGKGSDPESIPVPEPGQIGGYGVHFIRSHADTVQYRSKAPSGTRMTAEILLHYEDDAARAAAEKMATATEHPAAWL